jgi:hypothetical protein
MKWTWFIIPAVVFLVLSNDNSADAPAAASGNNSATAATGRNNRAPAATEVDSASRYNYASRRPSCSEYSNYTDRLKNELLDLDRYFRSHTAISLREEQDVGTQALRDLPAAVGGGRLVSSGATVDYLSAVAAPMLARVKRKDIRFRFHVLQGSAPANAFALPGGDIVFTQAILDEWVNNEAQLATILAHEIAHVDERHPVALIQYIKALGGDSSSLGQQMAMFIAKLPYSSALEGEADALGLRFLHAAGYSPFQSVRMWEERAGPAKKEPNATGWEATLNMVLAEAENLISSHPNNAKRACALKQEVYDLIREDGAGQSYVGTTNWREKVPKGRRVY